MKYMVITYWDEVFQEKLDSYRVMFFEDMKSPEYEQMLKLKMEQTGECGTLPMATKVEFYHKCGDDYILYDTLKARTKMEDFTSSNI